MTQNRVVEAESVFDLSKRFARALNVHEHVVSLHELLDRISELTTAPVFDAVNLTALFEDEGLVALYHRGDLFGLIRVHDDAQFIMTH